MAEEKVTPTLEQAELAFFDAHQVLTRLGVPFVLDGGTLLGFYRDAYFPEDDHDDIDFTCHSRMWAKADKICAAMRDQGFEVYHEWPRHEPRHWSAQLAFKRDNVKIDLMFKEWKPESEKVWWTVYGGRRGVTYKAVPLWMLDSAQTFPVRLSLIKKDLIVGIPGPVEEYLTYRYGEWQTPVHRSEYSCYKTDKCIVEPNTYEAI